MRQLQHRQRHQVAEEADALVDRRGRARQQQHGADQEHRRRQHLRAYPFHPPARGGDHVQPSQP